MLQLGPAAISLIRLCSFLTGSGRLCSLTCSHMVRQGICECRTALARHQRDSAGRLMKMRACASTGPLQPYLCQTHQLLEGRSPLLGPTCPSRAACSPMLTWTRFQSSTAWPLWWAFPLSHLCCVQWHGLCGLAVLPVLTCANPLRMCLLQTCSAAWPTHAPHGKPAAQC